MTDIATVEPLKVIAGDRLIWQRSFDDYPASGGWTLSYYLVHKTNAKITINAVAGDDGDSHKVDVDIATSGAWPAGIYNWQSFVSDGVSRYQVGEGELEVLTNFASGSVTTFDDRAHCEKVLEAIEAVIENRASQDQMAYTIEGRSLSRTPIADLLVFRGRYKAEVSRLRKADRIKAGLDSGSTIRVRFPTAT